ncbi:serine hydrolase domain-containing protein [Cerasicoccus maritimus]|uniref:serine hydrolase domain-containing protein n=1 Tax=Cerasicoccus maritimus TaxID=490089 RepID=UPI002852898E|nr:serine hydrolase [Cerasicoccus maritimus]
MPSINTPSQPNVISSDAAASVMQTLADISLHDGADSALLWQAGEVRWEGPVTDRIYNAWSCTKSFTSCCTGLMVDAGKLDIDAPAVQWLPELKEHYPNVTLRHLLTFTSGVQTRANDADPSIIIDPFDVREPRFPLGCCLHYSPESEWIALAIKRVSGQAIGELFREQIGDKIGIDYDFFRWGEIDTPDGPNNGGSGAFGAGVHTNPRNLLRFGQLLLQGGEWNGVQLISREWLCEATCSQELSAVPPWDALDGWYRDWLPGTYGLHTWVNGIKLNGQRLWPHGSGEVFAAQGNRNQICLVVPECDAIIVRMGDDGVINMRDYDLVIQRLKETL